MSSVKFASQDSHAHEDNNNGERHDLLHHDSIVDPTAAINMSLPCETFLKAAVSLKDQVILIDYIFFVAKFKFC